MYPRYGGRLRRICLGGGGAAGPPPPPPPPPELMLVALIRADAMCVLASQSGPSSAERTPSP